VVSEQESASKLLGRRRSGVERVIARKANNCIPFFGIFDFFDFIKGGGGIRRVTTM